jgi:hypothetical protein
MHRRGAGKPEEEGSGWRLAVSQSAQPAPVPSAFSPSLQPRAPSSLGPPSDPVTSSPCHAVTFVYGFAADIRSDGACDETLFVCFVMHGVELFSAGLACA